ncbi:Signal peptidase complex catalytic subunit SEC11C [Actinoplanes sp. SE50]|nr:Signal peptidase complex catalytic subunit SEC11C [Actinoplanes sp. SE50/110]ATO81214.1 Signal peptidase complex catalytic subunit SEC11C [Actinoplanes sp. SE50]SLL98621.1 S26 family signal peptidase [Actinoplanes sp. SE50/110]
MGEHEIVRTPGRAARRRRGVPALFSLGATGLLAAGGVLLLSTLIPPLFGWSSSVVMSGSMCPAIQPGDVVVTSPPAPRDIRAGFVVRFHDPSRPRRPILHRILTIDEHGMLVTKGDANRVVDSAPVPRSAVTGLGRLRVPYVGLPVLWWVRRDYLRLIVTGLVLLVLCALTSVGRTARPPLPGRRRAGTARAAGRPTT